jgi:hypothetical protein
MRLLIIALFSVFIAAALTGSSGCANIIPPAGGPRDSLPPQLISAVPADSTLNFRGDRITLTFDEYIDLQDVANNLLFTPTMGTNPEVSVKLRTITVRLRDTLDPNTTYIFNFGNAIKDLNEGNVLTAFTYTFSTGPALDSLTLSGKVVMAETGRIDTTLQVLLHKNASDSAIIKERPRYVTKLDAGGNFTFRNLPAGTFYIYALGNAGLLRRYTSKNQDLAFSDTPILVRSGVPSLTLYAYKEAGGTTSSGTSAAATPPRDRRGNAVSVNRLRYTTNLANGTQQDLLNEFTMSFDVPLRDIDTNKIILTRDTTFQRVAHSFLLDSSRRMLTLRTAWADAARYNLVLQKDFATDTAGRQLLKSDTLFFTTRKRSEYGSLNIRLRGVDAARNPVLQVVQNGTVVYAAPVGVGALNRPLFLPGEYELRVLYDRNKNGVWDPGRLFNGRVQPEIVQPIERKITVKPAFDNDFEIQL